MEVFILNRLCILFFLATFCVFMGGCSELSENNLDENNLDENNSGIVWITYDSIIPSDDCTPVDVVNEFLLQEGYSSRVIKTYYWNNGYSVERIYLGSDVDPSPLLSGLENLPGVLLAELDMDTEGLREDAPEGYLDELIVG